MSNRLADTNASARRLLIIASVWITLLIFGAVAILSAFHPKIGFFQLPTNPTVPSHASSSPGSIPVAGPVGRGGGSPAGQATLTRTGYPPGEPPGDIEDEGPGSSSTGARGSSAGSVIAPPPVPTPHLPALSPLPLPLPSVP